MFTIILALFFVPIHIASLGAVFLHHDRYRLTLGRISLYSTEVKANALILIIAIIFDVIVLAVFLLVKAQTDMLVIYAAIVGMLVVFAGERFFLHAKHND